MVSGELSPEDMKQKQANKESEELKMSSFVVDKKELMKAAGFVAAFVEREEKHNGMYIWNCKYNRPFNSEDVVASFELIHKMNAESVQEQYGDSEPYIDSESYINEFNQAKALTEKMLTFGKCWYADALKNNIYSFNQFSKSIMYQIENEKKHIQVKNFLNDINSRFIEILKNLDFNQFEIFSWGTFEMSDGTEEMQMYIDRINAMTA